MSPCHLTAIRKTQLNHEKWEYKTAPHKPVGPRPQSLNSDWLFVLSTLPTPKQLKQKPATSRLAPQKPNQHKDLPRTLTRPRLPATQGIKTFSSSLTSVEEGPLTHGLARWHQVFNQVHLYNSNCLVCLYHFSFKVYPSTTAS